MIVSIIRRGTAKIHEKNYSRSINNSFLYRKLIYCTVKSIFQYIKSYNYVNITVKFNFYCNINFFKYLYHSFFTYLGILSRSVKVKIDRIVDYGCFCPSPRKGSI